jgi:CspA family cold shock protein
MLHGTVKFFRDEGGFGFIVPDAPGPEMFFHRTSLVDRDTAREGQRVAFDIGTSHRSGKPLAVNVRIIGDSDHE